MKREIGKRVLYDLYMLPRECQVNLPPRMLDIMLDVIGCWVDFLLEIAYRQKVCPTVASSRMRLPDRATRGSSCSINAQSLGGGGGVALEPGNWWRMANEATEARFDIDNLTYGLAYP